MQLQLNLVLSLLMVTLNRDEYGMASRDGRAGGEGGGGGGRLCLNVIICAPIHSPLLCAEHLRFLLTAQPGGHELAQVLLLEPLCRLHYERAYEPYLVLKARISHTP